MGATSGHLYNLYKLLILALIHDSLALLMFLIY